MDGEQILNENYQITVNREQLILIAKCIEDIGRFAAGQPELYNTITELTAYDTDRSRLDEINEHLFSVKKLLYPELHPNASYGYNGGEGQTDRAKNLVGNAYQIYREMLRVLAEETKDKTGHESVYCSDTLPSGNLGTIKVRKL